MIFVCEGGGGCHSFKKTECFRGAYRSIFFRYDFCLLWTSSEKMQFWGVLSKVGVFLYDLCLRGGDYHFLHNSLGDIELGVFRLLVWFFVVGSFRNIWQFGRFIKVGVFLYGFCLLGEHFFKSILGGYSIGVMLYDFCPLWVTQTFCTIPGREGLCTLSGFNGK